MTIAIAGLALIAAARDGAMRTTLDTLVGQSKHPLSTCRVGTPGGHSSLGAPRVLSRSARWGRFLPNVVFMRRILKYPGFYVFLDFWDQNTVRYSFLKLKDFKLEKSRTRPVKANSMRSTLGIRI